MNATYQALLANGISVFAPNVRGSAGFGRRFLSLDDDARRVDAIADVKAAADYLVANRIAEPGHVGVMGESYGGWLTLAAVASYPSLFAAAVDQFGISIHAHVRKRRPTSRRCTRPNTATIRNSSNVSHHSRTLPRSERQRSCCTARTTRKSRSGSRAGSSQSCANNAPLLITSCSLTKGTSSGRRRTACARRWRSRSGSRRVCYNNFRRPILLPDPFMKLRAFAVLFVSASAFAVEVPSDLRIYNSDATTVRVAVSCGDRVHNLMIEAHASADVVAEELSCGAANASVDSDRPVVVTRMPRTEIEQQILRTDSACDEIALQLPSSGCRFGVASAAVAPVAGASYSWAIEGGSFLSGIGSERVLVALGNSATTKVTVVISSPSCTSTAAGVITLRDAATVSALASTGGLAGAPVTITWSYPGTSPAKQALSGTRFPTPVIVAADVAQLHVHAVRRGGETGDAERELHPGRDESATVCTHERQRVRLRKRSCIGELLGRAMRDSGRDDFVAVDRAGRRDVRRERFVAAGSNRDVDDQKRDTVDRDGRSRHHQSGGQRCGRALGHRIDRCGVQHALQHVASRSRRHWLATTRRRSSARARLIAAAER